MARIIPSNPRGKPDKAFTAFFKVLRKLPDDFTAWLPLGEEKGRLPQVFLVWRERHAFLIQVAATSQQLAESALQGELFGAPEVFRPEDLGKPESDVMEDFITRSSDVLGPLEGELPLKRLVVFPNVSEGTVDEVVMLRSEEAGTSYLGLRQIDNDRFARRLEALALAAMPSPQLSHLRRLYTPESEIPDSFVTRGPLQRNTGAGLPTRFLDFDQEWCVKNDLDLPTQQEGIAKEAPTAVRLVTGVAGSGKSLVLLYRALLAARLHPDARILVLTHNRPLRFELERRSKSFKDAPKNLTCLTFFQWANDCLPIIAEERWMPARTERCLTRLKQDLQSLARLSPAFLADEIGWIKDQRLMTRDLYLGADRTGRGTSLRAAQREEIWELFRLYQNELVKEKATDWHNIALRFHEAAVTERSLGFPRFDAVLIDEAQFFAKIWFEIVTSAIKPGGHLFLAADPAQGFLRRRQSWIAAGIDVRGRTTRLSQAYRNTRAILSYARDFYEGRVGADENEADLNVPDEAVLNAIPEEGEQPVSLLVANAQDEIARAVNEAAALMAGGLLPGKLLVIHADGRLEGALRSALEKKLGISNVHDAKTGPLPDGCFCSLTTLNAATGLEAPVVILLGVSRLLESEGDVRLSDDERAEMKRDHTRMLYVGFTRAGQRLIVIRSGAGSD